MRACMIARDFQEPRGEDGCCHRISVRNMSLTEYLPSNIGFFDLPLIYLAFLKYWCLSSVKETLYTGCYGQNWTRVAQA